MQVVFRGQFRFSVIPTIIFWNIIVYLMWWFLGDLENGFMARNFSVSWSALEEGRVWTLLTSAYSHYFLWHLLLNMFVLRSFGNVVENNLGSNRFIRFYLLAGIFSSFGHAAVSKFLIGQPSMPAVGASGAIAGVVLLFTLLYPREKLLFFGLIPMPAPVGAMVFVGLDLWGLSAQVGGHGLPIGHGAHLGGALTGVLYYLFVIGPKRRRDQANSRVVENVTYSRLE